MQLIKISVKNSARDARGVWSLCKCGAIRVSSATAAESLRRLSRDESTETMTPWQRLQIKLAEAHLTTKNDIVCVLELYM